MPREQKSHEFYNYDHEITPVDWNKIQSDNQARYDAAYGGGRRPDRYKSAMFQSARGQTF